MKKVFLAITTLMFPYGMTAEMPVSSSQNSASWFFGGRFGTAGIEGEVGYKFNETFRIRGGVSGFYHFRRNLSLKNLEIENLNMRLLMAKFILDWHFLKNGLRLSGGLVLNGNKFKFEKDFSNINLTAGGFTINTGPNARVFAKYRYRLLAPYVGIGYDTENLGTTKLSLSFDVGVLFQEKPKPTATMTGALTTQPLRTIAETYLNSLSKEHKWLKTYPIVSLGLRYTL